MSTIPLDWHEVADYQIVRIGDKCRFNEPTAQWVTVTSQSNCLHRTGKEVRKIWPYHIFITPIKEVFHALHGRIVDKEVFDSLLDPWPEGYG